MHACNFNATQARLKLANVGASLPASRMIKGSIPSTWATSVDCQERNSATKRQERKANAREERRHLIRRGRDLST